jgi:hypothetical protein
MNDEYGWDGYEMTDTWHIFGDPSLQVRTDTPIGMTVTHDSTISEGATSFDVYVPGVEDALCAISRNYGLLGSAYTDGSGHATIIFDEPITDEGDLDLVVTAFNKIPYSAIITVGGGATVDPDLSYVTLTDTNMGGLTSCPAGDGPAYQYVKITVVDSHGERMQGIPSDSFDFSIGIGPATYVFGLLSCTFIAIDATTDGNGEIRFEVVADTSITGDITSDEPGLLNIEVIVNDILINDLDTLECRSPDYEPDGVVDLSDFVLFANDFHNNGLRSDFNFDGQCNLIDFVMFAQHYGHNGMGVTIGDTP